MAVPQPSQFVVFAAGQSVSGIGLWMQKAAFGWLAWDLTHSPAAVGLIALAEPISAILLAPLAGAITDRASPLRLLASTQALLLAIPILAMAVEASNLMTYPAVLLLAFGDSFTQSFNHPVRMTIVGTLAGPERLSQAIATNSLAFNISRILGPAAAGILMVQTGETFFVFFGALLAFAFMLAVLAYLRTDLRTYTPPPPSETSIAQEIGEGFRYIVHTPRVATVFLLALVFSFLGRPFTELFPAIAGDMFQAGPEFLSALMSAQGVGALAGGFLMLRPRSSATVARITFAAALLMSFALVAFSLTGRMWLAIALIAVAGLGHVTCNIGMQSLTQLTADSSLRGRVVSLYGMVFRAAPALGAAVIGGLAHWIALEVLIGAGAALCALSILAIAAQRARYFALPEPEPAE